MCSGLDLQREANLPIIASAANFGDLGIVMVNDVHSHSLFIFVEMILSLIDSYIFCTMATVLWVESDFPWVSGRLKLEAPKKHLRTTPTAYLALGHARGCLTQGCLARGHLPRGDHQRCYQIGIYTYWPPPRHLGCILRLIQTIQKKERRKHPMRI